jgi:hypothetical protein
MKKLSYTSKSRKRVFIFPEPVDIGGFYPENVTNINVEME